MRYLSPGVVNPTSLTSCGYQQRNFLCRPALGLRNARASYVQRYRGSVDLVDVRKHRCINVEPGGKSRETCIRLYVIGCIRMDLVAVGWPRAVTKQMSEDLGKCDLMECVWYPR